MMGTITDFVLSYFIILIPIGVVFCIVYLIGLADRTRHEKRNAVITVAIIFFAVIVLKLAFYLDSYLEIMRRWL